MPSNAGPYLYVQDRNKLLDSAATSGVVTNYEGWRMSLKGKKFKLKNVTLFNVMGKDASKAMGRYTCNITSQ